MKQPPLEKSCAFCKRPVHENDAELIRRYEERERERERERVKNCDAQAMISLRER